MEREWEQHRAAISPLPAETPGWLWLSQAFLRSAPSLSCAGYQLQQQTQFPHGFLQLQWGKRMDREKGRGWTERRRRSHFSHLPFLTGNNSQQKLEPQFWNPSHAAAWRDHTLHSLLKLSAKSGQGHWPALYTEIPVLESQTGQQCISTDSSIQLFILSGL